MNKKQRIIMWIGLCLILISGLFPAYEGEWRREGDNPKNYLGYHFIFSPPSPNDVYEAFHGNRLSYRAINYNSNILFSHFLIQIIVIVILSFGLIILFADPKFERKFPINRKEI